MPVIVMVVMMVVAVTVPTGIGAALRFECGLLETHGQTEGRDHLVENMIVLVAQPPLADLQRHVAIAQVVGRPREQHRVLGRRG